MPEKTIVPEPPAVTAPAPEMLPAMVKVLPAVEAFKLAVLVLATVMSPSQLADVTPRVYRLNELTKLSVVPAA